MSQPIASPPAALPGNPRRVHDRPGRPPRIDLDAVLAAALESGLESLSVASVARRLGVTDAAIYRYVDSRDQLVALASSRALEAWDIAGPDIDDWRAYLRVVCDRVRGLLVAHPGLSRYVLQGPYTPATLATFRAIERELIARRPGTDVHTAHLVGSQAVCLTTAYVQGNLVGAPGEAQPDIEATFDWTLRALIAGMDAAIASGDVVRRRRSSSPPDPATPPENAAEHAT